MAPSPDAPMPPLILIVDDDPVQRRLLEAAVTRFGYAAIAVDGGEAALAELESARGERVALIVLDLAMPGLDGMGVLARLTEAGSEVPVIVQTSHGGIDTVVAAMRAGATDFVVKPASPERLKVSIENALKLSVLEDEIARIKRSASGTLTFRDIVTRSPAMAAVIALGQRAAASQIPILIEGESGVGKELVARAIQGSGARRAKPFVTVNCGAIPDNLVESILFGHEKGAFTGAGDRHAGKFQEADGGTLLLDEVGELPPEAQVKLLRALQDGEVDPVGAKRPIRIDFRLVSATNRRLADLVAEGRFREDLYYRLNVFPIAVPPLRDRPEDIPDLVRHFAARFAAEERKSALRGVDPDALALLAAYAWPGNVRQLENAVFRAVVLADGPTLTVNEFPQILQSYGLTPPPLSPKLAEAIEPDPAGGANLAVSLPGRGAGAQPGSVTTLDGLGQLRPLADIEADVIRAALDHCQGRMATVARRLGIGRSTLYRKLREFNLVEGADSLTME